MMLSPAVVDGNNARAPAASDAYTTPFQRHM